jgi:glutamyl-tRNA synthetase
MTDIRVRFAPSPTGYLHVGGARTALFNWLFARHHGGVFILRIEDTDRERSSDEMTVQILEALKWMGLDWDDGPFFQSEGARVAGELAGRLVSSGAAYPCFCPPELLTRKREAAKGNWKYDRVCATLSEREIARRQGSGEPFAIRFRIPEGDVAFDDQVFGTISKGSDELEDFVIVRSNGEPTYQLSVVADDIAMRVSHVIRGADHIANTPKQVLLYRALDAVPPAFAHVPLILGPDKSRLSKRHGATSVLEYRDQGTPPDAFVNFLALLGWSEGTDREIFERDALVEAFSLDGISKANAVFDSDKLSWFSGQHINAMAVEKLVTLVQPWLVERGFRDGPSTDRIAGILALVRPRFRSLETLAGEVGNYLGEDVEYEPAAIEKFFAEPRLGDYLPMLAQRLESAESFDLESTETIVRGLAGELEVKAGLLINASRVALTGKAVAPGIFDVMVVLGRQKTVSRLRRAAAVIPA